MRIALMGGGGQLAQDLKLSLADHDLTSFTREQVDLTQSDTIRQHLDPLPLNVVVNTAAYNLVDRAESEPAEAFSVNSIGVANLARYCGERSIRLLHFSTDYVFGLDTDRTTPWAETDGPGPVSVYGLSKLAGEYAVRMYAPDHLILRTCGLYGASGSRGKGGNFVETMLRVAASGKPLRVVCDQTCTPSATVDVAEWTANLIQTPVRGILNLTNSGQTTWFEFAREIFAQSGVTAECSPINSVEYGLPARRPSYSVLDLTKVSELVGTPPDWRDALRRYLAQTRSRRVAGNP